MESEQNSKLEAFLSPGTYSSDPTDIEPFILNNPVIGKHKSADFVIRPKDRSEVEGLVKYANETGLNITVSSSTGKHTKGGFISSSENILLDLSSWNEIEWINRRNRVCLIQPGVTYGELVKTLALHDMTVSMPLAPREGKSVIAAVMDREPSTWPNKQWDISDPAASTEFIFGNGDLFRTGAAGGPGSLEKQRESGGAQKCPLGPSQTDFHRVIQGSQGSMGIVTWITLRTEIKPTIEESFLIGSDNLDPLIPYVYQVQRPHLGEHSFILDRTSASMLMSAAGYGSFNVIYDSIPEYICLQNIAGFERMPKSRVEYQKKDIEEIATKNNLSMEKSLGHLLGKDLLKTATHPLKETDWRHHLKGHCLSIFFLTTLNRTQKFSNYMKDLTKEYAIDEKFTGSYIQPVVQNRACHMEFMLPFDPDNKEEVSLMLKFEKEAVAGLSMKGAFFSRPYGDSMASVFNQNPVNTDLIKKVKDIFDPNKVLNRGKWNL